MVAATGSPISAQRAGADARPPAGPVAVAASVAVERLRLAVGWPDEAARARILAWLDAGLRPGRPGHLAREYPLLFATGSEATPICLLEDDEPAAFCLLWPARFTLGSGLLRTGLVSLVYTDPAHRRRGFARRAVAAAMETAARQGLGLVLLWSELHDFYRAQGFARSGVETLLVVDRAVLARARSAIATGGSWTVEAAKPADWPAIFELRRERPCADALADPGGRLAAIPGLDVRVARRGAELVGFAMRGRGDDFEGVVHEWGGEPESVLACCDAWLPPEDPAAGFLMLSPKGLTPLTACLRRAGARVVAQPLAHWKLASPDAFAADLASVLPALAALRLGRAATIDDATPRVRLEERASETRLEVTEATLFDALFGHPSEATASAARSALAPILPAGVAESLPLPFFVWGLESI